MLLDRLSATRPLRESGLAIVRIDKGSIDPLPATSLKAGGIRERLDLQRLLKDTIGIVGEDLLVIAEEFGEWEESRRRIDLLALDRTGISS